MDAEHRLGFLARLRDGAERAIIVGVEAGIIVALVLLAVSMVLGDYSVVRERAYNGQRAWEFIQNRMNQAAAAQAAPPSEGSTHGEEGSNQEEGSSKP